MRTPITVVVGICTLFVNMAGTVLAQQTKAPYNPLIFDLDGEDFVHKGSSASTPTQDCSVLRIGNTWYYAAGHPPVGTGCTQHFSNAAGGGFGIGVRPLRYLQVDGFHLTILGNFNSISHVPGVFQCTSGCSGSYTFATATEQGLVTTGARVVLPLFRERLLLSAGGGIGWLMEWEHVNANGSGVQAACTSCKSAGGHGPQEIAEIMYFPRKYFGIGFNLRDVQIRSRGLTDEGLFSNLYSGTQYKDHFLLIGGGISVRLPWSK